MKIFCQYSGVEYTTPDFGSLQLTYVHPIFSAEPRTLLSRAGDWASGSLNEQERRLLFLALLHCTELVKFKATAVPAPHNVQANMESLLKIVGWLHGIQHPALALPSFVITPETRELQNVRHWLAAWWNARKDFEDGYHDYSELRKQRNRETALERLIKSSSKKTEDYIGMLSQWAFEASNTPLALREYWKKIICSRSTSIYAVRTVDLEEIVEHMEENLEHGSIFAADFMKHVRILLKKNKAGLNYGLGMDDDAELNYKQLMQTPFQIVEGDADTEAANRSIIISTAPESAPEARNYPSRVAFLRAKIAYEWAQRAAEASADLEAENARKAAQEDIQAADAAADAESFIESEAAEELENL